MESFIQLIVITYRADRRFHHRHKRDIRLRYVITCAHGVFFAPGTASAVSAKKTLYCVRTHAVPEGVVAIEQDECYKQ